MERRRFLHRSGRCRSGTLKVGRYASDFQLQPSAKQGKQLSQARHFPEVLTSIQQAIAALDGHVIPKLNWSCPKVKPFTGRTLVTWQHFDQCEAVQRVWLTSLLIAVSLLIQPLLCDCITVAYIYAVSSSRLNACRMQSGSQPATASIAPLLMKSCCC